MMGNKKLLDLFHLVERGSQQYQRADMLLVSASLQPLDLKEEKKCIKNIVSLPFQTMANHVLAINTFLDNGLKHRDLDNILASNCVVDWFGRTFIGHHKIVSFYLNSNTTYEHSMNNVEETEAIEERPYHFLT